MTDSLLFVYGTLMRGFNNPFAHWLQQYGDYVQKGQMRGRLYDVGHYPCAIYDPDAPSFVQGEIWHLADFARHIDKLDHYEGIFDPNPDYKRLSVSVTFADTTIAQCQAYLWCGPIESLIEVPHGDYRRWLGDTSQHLP